MKNLIPSFLLVLLIISNINCQSFKNWNSYSIDDDKKLGAQVAAEIASKPAQFPILPEKGNEEAYAFVRGIANQIINSGRVKNKNNFKWEVHIIKDDKTLNAFCTPGGYIYVYTGLIKFLDYEDELAGVMGHEIAHADLRHSTKQLTKSQGTAVLAQILAIGAAGAGGAAVGQAAQSLAQVATAVVGLKFSRTHEREADKFSVFYLCNSNYNAAGCAGFFKKMKGRPSPPVFLSSHPDPGNRVQDITKQAQALKCQQQNSDNTRFNRIKSLL